MLYVLLQKGIHGKIFDVLASMYKSVKAAVKISNTSATQYFNTLSGVKQGCILSPLLFSLFVAELESMLQASDVRGIFVGQDYLDILMLMYADDICLIDDSVFGLYFIIFVTSGVFLLTWTKQKC